MADLLPYLPDSQLPRALHAAKEIDLPWCYSASDLCVAAACLTMPWAA